MNFFSKIISKLGHNLVFFYLTPNFERRKHFSSLENIFLAPANADFIREQEPLKTKVRTSIILPFSFIPIFALPPKSNEYLIAGYFQGSLTCKNCRYLKPFIRLKVIEIVTLRNHLLSSLPATPMRF